MAWLLAWQRYRQVRDLKLPPPKMTDAHKALLLQAGTQIKPYLERTPRFAEFWRLAANLVALHPQSIPGMDQSWEFFAREYEIALSLRPASDRMAARAPADSADGLAPGSLVWRADGRFAVKVTAFVEDGVGKRYLLLPAMLAQDAELPLPLFAASGSTQGTEPIAMAVRYLHEAASPDTPRLLLAELRRDVQPGAKGRSVLGDPPGLGDELSAKGEAKPGRVTRIELTVRGFGADLVEVSPRITSAGDAGVPILDRKGRLVAMGYAGNEQSSILLPLHSSLRENGLALLD